MPPKKRKPAPPRCHPRDGAPPCDACKTRRCGKYEWPKCNPCIAYWDPKAPRSHHACLKLRDDCLRHTPIALRRSPQFQLDQQQAGPSSGGSEDARDASFVASREEARRRAQLLHFASQPRIIVPLDQIQPVVSCTRDDLHRKILLLTQQIIPSLEAAIVDLSNKRCTAKVDLDKARRTLAELEKNLKKLAQDEGANLLAAASAAHANPTAGPAPAAPSAAAGSANPSGLPACEVCALPWAVCINDANPRLAGLMTLTCCRSMICCRCYWTHCGRDYRNMALPITDAEKAANYDRCPFCRGFPIQAIGSRPPPLN